MITETNVPNDLGETSFALAQKVLGRIKKKRILLIEDNDNDAIMATIVLREFEIVTVKNAEDGLERFKKEAFDLVIADVGLPGMDGVDCAIEMKRINPKQMIGICSGATERMIPKAVRAGFVVIPKPISLENVTALMTF